MKRFSERYGDLDLEDEDNYYERANKLMDDYERYESATKNLVDTIDGNETFLEMLTEACVQDDFDPVVWMVEKHGLDLKQAMEDPDYAAVIASAHSKYLEGEAAKKEIRMFSSAMPVRALMSSRLSASIASTGLTAG